MAILTPTRAVRDTPARPAVRDSVAAWLAHPLADAALVVVPTILLLGLGTLMVWSASTVYGYVRFGDSSFFLWRQLGWVAVGLAAAAVASRIPTERLRAFGWVFYALAAVLILLTFTPLGYSLNGNRNWLNFGGSSMTRLQPSELAKLALIAWGATILATKRRLLHQPGHLLVPFLPGSLVLMGLVVLQRDLGTATILGAIVLAVLWCVGAPLRVLGGMLAVVGAGAAALVAASPGRMARILGFLDPAADPTGINHQPQQALYGLASGGWWGRGLGESRMKWGGLVEAHTDYVLAIIGEELGLFGTLSVLALFMVLGYAGFRIALRAPTMYARILAGGITSWFMLQAAVNVMVVLRMAPVIGVPLPLVSYGGSALLANLLGLGILVSCALEEPDARAWLTRHRSKKGPGKRLSAVFWGRRPAT